MGPARHLVPLLVVGSVALVAGFIILALALGGGPLVNPEGRLDTRRLTSMDDLAEAAKCAYAVADAAPATRTAIADIVANDALPFGSGPCSEFARQRGYAELEGRAFDLHRHISNLDVEYEVVDSRRIRLCSIFDESSDGQETLSIFPDYVRAIGSPELTKARPAGRHCFVVDVGLPYSREEFRDASRMEAMNVVATAAECVAGDIGHLPDTLAGLNLALGPMVVIGRRDSSCNYLLRDPLSGRVDISYTVVNDSTIELCSEFERSHRKSDRAVGDYYVTESVRFPELAEDRPAGKQCYQIALRLPAPDPAVRFTPTWDEPIDVEALPKEIRTDATNDSRAIGDAVNVIRMAGCAYRLGGEAPTSFEAGLEIISRLPAVADRDGCGWAPSYFSTAYNKPVASYDRIDRTTVNVCVDYRRAWPSVMQLNYYGSALLDWPKSLAALQAPVEKGRHCYAVDLSKQS